MGLEAGKMTQRAGETETCPACGRPMYEAHRIDAVNGRSLPRHVLFWCANDNCSHYTAIEEPSRDRTDRMGEPAAG
jgi:hypothetical protein